MLLYARGIYHAFDGQTWSFKKRYIAVSDGSIINKMGHLMSKKDIQNTLSLKDDDDIQTWQLDVSGDYSYPDFIKVEYEKVKRINELSTN